MRPSCLPAGYGTPPPPPVIAGRPSGSIEALYGTTTPEDPARRPNERRRSSAARSVGGCTSFARWSEAKVLVFVRRSF